MEEKARAYFWVVAGALSVSLLVSFTRPEPFGLAYVNSLFMVALALFCIGVAFTLLQAGGFDRMIIAFRLFFKHSGKLGNYVLENESMSGDKGKKATTKGKGVLIKAGAWLVLAASLASLPY